MIHSFLGGVSCRRVLGAGCWAGGQPRLWDGRGVYPSVCMWWQWGGQGRLPGGGGTQAKPWKIPRDSLGLEGG